MVEETIGVWPARILLWTVGSAVFLGALYYIFDFAQKLSEIISRPLARLLRPVASFALVKSRIHEPVVIATQPPTKRGLPPSAAQGGPEVTAQKPPPWVMTEDEIIEEGVEAMLWKDATKNAAAAAQRKLLKYLEPHLERALRRLANGSAPDTVAAYVAIKEALAWAKEQP